MPVLMIHYQVADEGIAEVVEAVEAAFEAVAEKGPAGIRYAYYRVAGGNEFVALLDLDEGVENPLFGIPAAGDLQATVAKRALGEPPTPRPLEVIGSYSG
ncbi:hypothetical protein [Phytohabitans houttuyneae]|uniref:ABM domain-containing protein n=1 Tax=Phytohabitans houttuyneae TaxID=1076126 RepID=A0A6V8K8T5_9ACTN|nr:hypothetical protein [Phytohabitans houttuyneae]GFJ78549.1 hypothetical protein Phou_027290 [Phytohabitans houttuyneae]